MKGKKIAVDKTSWQEQSEGTPHGDNEPGTAVICQPFFLFRHLAGCF